MHFSFIATFVMAVAISLVFIENVSAAPTKRSTLNSKRAAPRHRDDSETDHIAKRAGAAAAYSFPQPGVPPPPVCPDPKDPRCPPVPAALPPATPPPPQGVAIPGFALPVFPDIAASTAGLGTAPALPDPAGIVGGLITSQATAVGGIVPGIMGGVTGLTQLGGGQQDD